MKIVSRRIEQELYQRAGKPIRFNSLYAAVLVGLMQAKREVDELLNRHTKDDRDSRER